MRGQTTRESEMIRQARLKKGYTQQQAATLMGVQIKAFQRLEYGERDIRNASMKFGLTVCAVLGIDPFVLVLGGEFHAGPSHAE